MVNVLDSHRLTTQDAFVHNRSSFLMLSESGDFVRLQHVPTTKGFQHRLDYVHFSEGILVGARLYDASGNARMVLDCGQPIPSYLVRDRARSFPYTIQTKELGRCGYAGIYEELRRLATITL